MYAHGNGTQQLQNTLMSIVDYDTAHLSGETRVAGCISGRINVPFRPYYEFTAPLTPGTTVGAKYEALPELFLFHKKPSDSDLEEKYVFSGDVNNRSLKYYPPIEANVEYQSALIDNINATYAHAATYSADDDVVLTGYSYDYAWYYPTDTYQRPIGVDSSRTERVSAFTPNAYPNNGTILDGYSYQFVGETRIENMNTGEKAGTVTSSNINQYPRDGVQKNSGSNDYFYYMFAGLVRSTIETYNPNVVFDCNSHQSVGSSNSFAIGTVGGATAQFEVLRPYVDVEKYLGYDCYIHYTYEDNYGSHYYQDGIYTIRELEENGANRTIVGVYDFCYKLDCKVMPLINRISANTSIKKLFYYICAYCDIPYYGNEVFINSDLTIGDLTGIDKNTTCRTVVEWIAQITGNLVICDKNGFLIMKNLEAPLRSRGSDNNINRSLKVSMVPLVKPEAIRITTYADTLTIGDYGQWENRVLDYTSNAIIKNHSTLEMEDRIGYILDSISRYDDIYSFTCDVADNRYGVMCGDS